MQPRAFLVMPFGRKPVDSHPGKEIDFDRVYRELLEPALREAGYEVIRTDKELEAGEIRTDMFFELVTADLVVADVSLPNANVFYELGVRHGVCPGGVFIINSNLLPVRPFDISPDRSFSYDATSFLGPHSQAHAPAKAEPAVPFEKQKDFLTKTFREAIGLERETIGSPVYSQLPGLRAVNWDDIETPKAKYFSALQADWLGRVTIAQNSGRPGDILTLAQNAPTRLHESRTRYEAARALIGLCRYSAAERVLREVIRLDPAHTDAQIQLALVLSHLDDVEQAEQQLRKLSSDYTNQPLKADLLGQVFRHLWHLSWQSQRTADQRRKRAQEAAQVGISAVQSFLKAHRADPSSYFAGFNALMLDYVLTTLDVRDRPWAVNELDELKAVTRYVARNQQQRAIEDGDDRQQFWSTTTLAGLLFLEQHDNEAVLSHIAEACAIPGSTLFQLRSFWDRLELLDKLDVRLDFVDRALEIVESAISEKHRGCFVCQRVFLWAGYPIDAPKRRRPRFPGDRVDAITRKIETALTQRGWNVREGDLAICGGTTESDVIFAEICHKLGAQVRIMMRHPIGNETSEPLWPFTSSEWNQRLHQLLLAGDRKEAWFDTDHLGSPVGGSGSVELEHFVRLRQRQWLINTSEMEAEPMTDVKKAAGAGSQPSTERLYGLFLWDGGGTPDDLDEPSFLIQRVNEFNGHQGLVQTINPTDA